MNILYYLVNRGHSIEYALNLTDYEKMLVAGMIRVREEIEEGGG